MVTLVSRATYFFAQSPANTQKHSSILVTVPNDAGGMILFEFVWYLFLVVERGKDMSMFSIASTEAR